MSIFSEFKTFAMKGNVVDMATGIVIGAVLAFRYQMWRMERLV